jgi:hypothetical protein
VLYQRYADADLATVGEEVSLEKTYGQKSTRRVWLAVVGGVVGLLVLGGLVWALTRPKKAPAGPGLPEKLDPFITAALLREIRARPELPAGQRPAIDRDIARVEEYYFSADRNGFPAPDLRGMVERWAAAVPANTGGANVPA